jgi:lipopolysaccharide/colanic/teichoic acid biosynthesis glycosyltransferase
MTRAKELALAPLFTDHLLSHGYQFYGEADFNTLIQRERERTERSKKYFLLMLLDVKGLSKQRGRPQIIERMAYTLCAHSRSIDLKGWYRRNTVFGILFTELAQVGEELRERLSGKIRHALAEVLRPDELQKVVVSLHVYPEGEEECKRGGSSVFDLCLYPDLSRRNRRHRVSLVVKRIMDILGSLCALVLLSPLFLVIAVAIKAFSPGPVLYRQRRMGFAGKEFVFLKFRSMYRDNDPNTHIEYIRNYIGGRAETGVNGTAAKDPVYKITNDPRVTPLGKFLRRTSLDELPQFLNALKGDMSLVGPRPPIPYECESYETWHRRRMLSVKPGLTGLWQVKGRSATMFDEMVRLDLRYINNWSLWLDLKILFQTPGTVIAGKGAY